MSDRIAITSTRIFDGHDLSDQTSVVIDGSVIGDATATTAETIDGAGMTLLPGLIDCHVHIRGVEHLERARQLGVTTMMDMAHTPLGLVNRMRDLPGLPDVRTAGYPGGAPGGLQTVMMDYPADSGITGAADAERFVTQMREAGADYIKILSEDPRVFGDTVLSVETMAAVVDAAHRHGLKTVTHATSVAAIERAHASGTDAITHSPTDRALDSDLAQRVAAAGQVSIPPSS